MTFIKKMCILRQVKQGFSGDGRTLSGLIKVEQYGKNVAVEVSVVNFAPLSSGEYYCLIADERERTELLPLRGKSFFNIVSDLDFSGGFCGVICFVKNEILPVAYGVNGNKVYDFKRLLKSVVPQAEYAEDESQEDLAFSTVPQKEEQPSNPPQPQQTERYDDETVASVNYYMQEKEENERVEFEKSPHHVRVEDRDQGEDLAAGKDSAKNEYAQDVLHPFTTQSDGYYVSVRSEIDELFKNNPKDDSLSAVFPASEWVKITRNGKSFSVGVLYEELKAKYVCYAIPATANALPPEEIKDVCVFVPVAPTEESNGFFVIFQSAATGECVHPSSV